MAAGFDYNIVASSGSNRYRHYISLPGGARQTKVGTFQISTSTGLVTISGVGFQPDAVIMFGAETAGLGFVSGAGLFHLGAAAGGNQWAGAIFSPHLTGLSPYQSVWKNNQVISAFDMEATFDTFLADGFRINVTTAPTTAMACAYLALKGEGSYHVGTSQCPTGAGSQSITGLGFQPSAILFATAQRTALSLDSDMARMSIGGADANSQHNAWTGGKSGDPYNDNRPRDTKCISMYEDADGGGPFHPTLQAEAELTSLDADGFTLNWTTTDGTARYYSWIAFSGGAEEGRWTYNNLLNRPVQTVAKPQGLIFFCNDKADDTYPLGHNAPGGTFGFSLGFGVCDSLLNQYYASLGAHDAPGFSQMPSVRELGAAAFGSYESRTGGVVSTMPNNARDVGVIGELLSARRPQIIRYRW